MIPIPLTVRLANADVDRHIERELRSLSFRSTAPGGYASATFALDRPLAFDPFELAYYSKVCVYDARNAAMIWEGRLEDPGRSAGADGQVWELAAVGPAAHAQDQVVPRVYVDQSTERWLRDSISTAQGTVTRSDLGTDNETPSIILNFPEGMTISSPLYVSVMYRTLYDCGQQVARIRTDYQNAITDSASFKNSLVTRTGPNGTSTIVNDDDWASGASSFNAARGSALNPIPAGEDVVIIRTVRHTGNSVATANRWSEYWGMSVRSMLKDVNGTDITTANYYDNVYVLASEVITDLIGRGDLPMYDPATSTITTTAYGIEQLAFPSGATPAEILDALMDFEPAYYWAAWESGSTGLYRFEWKAWPTTVRYEAGVVDGFDSPGSAEGLYNKALVSYRDWRGRERSATSTSTVAELTGAGLTRTIYVDLSEESNSLANAQRAGAQALAEHATPPNEGTLTIACPIIDIDKGIKVQPWEIQPGNLIRVRGVKSNRDSLNATIRDGVTVFKIASVTYDTSSATATLELDAYSRTIASALAKLKKKPAKRR